MEDHAALELKVVVLSHGEGLALPAYESAFAAGLDLRAAVPDDAPVALAPHDRSLVPTGLAMAIPQGFEGQIRPRSGVALRDGVSVLNSPGTIDADYRGEIKVLLVNLGSDTYVIERGQRIAQLVVVPVVQAHIKIVGSLDSTRRGAGGFGSTGRT